MGNDFLEKLNLTDEERRALSALGATSLVTIAEMIHVSRLTFEQLMGRKRAHEIESMILDSLTPEERLSFKAKPRRRFPTGAKLRK